MASQNHNSRDRFYQIMNKHTQLLLLAFIPLVRGGYELRMRALSYSNPSHRHARGGCCDDPCSNHCDNYFVFCLRPAGYSHQIWRCPLGVIYTGEVGGDSLTFGSLIGMNQQNPILFSNSGNWPVSFIDGQDFSTYSIQASRGGWKMVISDAHAGSN